MGSVLNLCQFRWGGLPTQASSTAIHSEAARRGHHLQRLLAGSSLPHRWDFLACETTRQKVCGHPPKSPARGSSTYRSDSSPPATDPYLRQANQQQFNKLL